MKKLYSTGMLIMFSLISVLQLSAQPSVVWTEITDYDVWYHTPYDVPLEDRYSNENGVEYFKVYSDDASFEEGSYTNPRSEVRVRNNYTTGNHQMTFDMKIPYGTTGCSVFQIFGGGPSTGATSLMLHTYDGDVNYYVNTTLLENVYDEWHSYKIQHYTETGDIYIYVDGELAMIKPDRGDDNHYFKYGVYMQWDSPSYLMEAYFKNVRIYEGFEDSGSGGSPSADISDINVSSDGTYLIFDISGSDLGDGYDLYLNTDNNSSTGYQDVSYSSSGADYLVQNGTLYASTGTGWSWSAVSGATVSSTHSGSGAYVTILESNLSGLESTISYAYKDLLNWNDIVSYPSSGGYASVALSSGGGAFTADVWYTSNNLYFNFEGDFPDGNYDLLLNTDGNTSTGYGSGGADYLIENGTVYQSTSSSSWSWTSLGSVYDQIQREDKTYISVQKSYFNNLASTFYYSYSHMDASWNPVLDYPEDGSYASASSGVVQSSSICVDLLMGIDDVEEGADGTIYTNSSDLELSEDGSNNQQIGLRFQGVWIPQGATITNAYIQFACDETSTGSTILYIKAENTNDAAPFSTSPFNISGRTWTSDYIWWSPSAWNTVGERSSAQRTPDLSPIVQEVVNRGGWVADNDMAFKIYGEGVRTAESYDGSSSSAAQLCVEFIYSLKSTEGKPKETFSVNVELDQVLAYPNPVRDVLYLKNIPEQTSIQLFDMTGKLVLEKQNQNQINVSGLNSGLYIMSVYTQSEIKRIMITKQ